MKSARPLRTETSAHEQGRFTLIKRIAGTGNPRHFRASKALLAGPTSRESLDATAGYSNSLEPVAALRRRGLAIPCERTWSIDRDGQLCRPGVDRLSLKGRCYGSLAYLVTVTGVVCPMDCAGLK